MAGDDGAVWNANNTAANDTLDAAFAAGEPSGEILDRLKDELESNALPTKACHKLAAKVLP